MVVSETAAWPAWSNRGLDELQKTLYVDRLVFEELCGWYLKERLGEEGDGGKER